MSGTNYSSTGFRRITRLGQPVRIRLFGFMMVVVGGGLLLGWITHSLWTQLDGLQREHAAVRSESFYLGVGLRGSIRSLNDKLVQFNPISDPEARDEFFKEATMLRRMLETNRVQLAELAKLPLLKQVLIDDFDILNGIHKELENYMTQAGTMLLSTNSSSKPLSFEERYHLMRVGSRKLLDLCDDLARAQREDFSNFLAETQGNLASHQRMLGLTLGLIVTLAAALAALVYRGMIAPLRLGLTQSKTIIERQEKLASLGVLASGVAHEIRNPLTAIKFRLFSLKKAVPSLLSNEDASIIADEINRLEGIVRDFLRFARPSEPELTTTETGRIVREVHDLMKGQLEREGIELRAPVQTSAWVHADRQQLKQVLINLIQNAVEAIDKNGTVTVQVREDEAELDGRLKPVAILAVTDTGTGIPPLVEARLFDPFFTTKEGGTGLGLAIAARIVEKHGGMLRYETQVNRGTTFEVVLPRVEHDATETAVNRG